MYVIGKPAECFYSQMAPRHDILISVNYSVITPPIKTLASDDFMHMPRKSLYGNIFGPSSQNYRVVKNMDKSGQK